MLCNASVCVGLHIRMRWSAHADALGNVCGCVFGRLDDYDKSMGKVTSNNSGKDPNEDISYWAWKDTGETTRYRFFQLQNGNQWIGYNEVWVSNRNHS